MKKSIFLTCAVALYAIAVSASALGTGYKYVGSIGTEIPAQYFVDPVGICADSGGTLYVLDGELGRFFTFDPDGRMIRSWGNGALRGMKAAGIRVVCSEKGVLSIAAGPSLLRFERGGKLLSKVEIPSPSGSNFVPSGIAVDPQGCVYISDKANSCVYKFDADGKSAGRIGTKGRGAGELIAPTGIAVDPEGNIAIGDEATGLVQKFDPSGTYLRWSVGGISDAANPPAGKFDKIGSVAISEDGTISIADAERDLISRFDRLGKYLGRYSPASDGDSSVIQSMILCGGKSPGLWTLDTKDKVVQKFDPESGKPLMQFASVGEKIGQIATPWKLAVDGDGNIYVLDLQRCRVMKFSDSGKLLATIGSAGNGKGEIGMPSGLVMDPTGKFLYIADSGNDRIEKFSVSGEFVSDFHGQDVKKEEWSPTDLSIDRSGDLFIPVAIDGGSIQEFSSAGVLVGTYLKSKLEFMGACLPDNAGNIYVGGKHWVYKYDLSSGEQIGKIGGPPVHGESDAGKLYYPVDMKIGPNGHLFVVDVNPSGDRCGRVQEFDAAGSFVGSIGGADSDAGAFAGASAVAIGRAGDVYVSDVGKHRVVHFAPAQ
jgi:DNA-binding beta-propeller fold protein YncE